MDVLPETSPFRLGRVANCLMAGLGVGLAAATLGACTTGMTADSCASTDWFALGETDGRRGETAGAISRPAERCAKLGAPADLTRYDAGRTRGLEFYCTTEGGYEAGRSGQAYRNVCPPDREAGFLAEYDIGFQLFSLTSAYDDAVKRYESALNALEQHRYNLRLERQRIDNPNLSAEDREKARREVEYHRREIERLQNDLPLMKVEIDRSRDRLDDFRDYLRRIGRN